MQLKRQKKGLSTEITEILPEGEQASEANTPVHTPAKYVTHIIVGFGF